jgi:hypothetical protein
MIGPLTGSEFLPERESANADPLWAHLAYTFRRTMVLRVHRPDFFRPLSLMSMRTLSASRVARISSSSSSAARAFPVLGILNQEDHQEGHDGSACVDYGHPVVRKAGDSTKARSDQHAEKRDANAMLPNHAATDREQLAKNLVSMGFRNPVRRPPA